MSSGTPDDVERLRAEVEALESRLDVRRGRPRRRRPERPPPATTPWGWWERGLVALVCVLVLLVGFLGGRWVAASRAAPRAIAPVLQLPVLLPASPTTALEPTPPVSSAAPSPTAVPDIATLIALDSAPGDPIGAGRRLVFAPDRAEISVTTDSGACRNLTPTPRMLVDAEVSEGPDHFELTFAGPIGAQLRTGSFAGLELYPFCNPVKGGFAAAGDGRTCTTARSSFTVEEIAFAADGTLQRFAARFEQICQGTAPPLEGEVRFNATVPATPV